MAKKESVFKKMFSKSNKDCCSVEIEEVDSSENDSRSDEIKNKSKKKNSSYTKA